MSQLKIPKSVNQLNYKTLKDELSWIHLKIDQILDVACI